MDMLWVVGFNMDRRRMFMWVVGCAMDRVAMFCDCYPLQHGLWVVTWIGKFRWLSSCIKIVEMIWNVGCDTERRGMFKWL